MPAPRDMMNLISKFVLITLFLIQLPAAVPAQTQGDSSTDTFRVELGFGGRIKLGCWQPFLVTTSDRLEPTQFEITVLDGDETPITYRGPLHAVGSELNEHQGYLKLGKGFGSVELKLLDRDGLEVARRSFSLRQLNGLQIAAPTDSMVLTIEPRQGIVEAIASTSISERTRGSGSRLTRASQLPLDAFCYEGVEAIYLVPGEIDWLDQVSKLQWDALKEYVFQGGQLIVSVNPRAQSWFVDSGALSRFIEGRITGEQDITNSSRLDAFAGSQANQALLASAGDSLALSTIEDLRGIRVVEQDGLACIVRRALGWGEVVLVTFDLNDQGVTQWGGYKNLIYRLQHRIPLQDAAQIQRASSRGKAVSHPGYDDLVGQLRVPLDRFSKVQFLSFNWIALLIGLYVLCIGPGDYFFLRRLTGKMELTWITFPLISLLFCGLAVWISTKTRSDQMQFNQLEVIDIDASSGRVRGTAWSNFYSPRAGTCQIALSRENALGIEINSDLVGWHGLPGKGFGGMQSQTGVAVVGKPYLHRREQLTAEKLGGFSQLESVPLNVSSTKPLLTQYRGTLPTRIQSNLKVRPRGLGLAGTFTNPFDFPLKNCRLLFENDAYELPRPLEPGEAIAVESETRVRTLVGFLTRRRAVADEEAKSRNTQNLPWDINETRIPRIADIMMFYSAAGGNNYTGLTHDYQSYIDLSEQLDLGRAILVAEIDGVGTPLTIDGQTITNDYDQTVTIVRMVLPVSDSESSR